MPKKLKTHAASFKFKVVLESFTSSTVAETARKCQSTLAPFAATFWNEDTACFKRM